MNENQVVETLHRVRDDIVVGPPPILQVTAGATRRRRVRAAGIVAAVAASAVVAAGVVAALPGDDGRVPEPAQRIVENPASVGWWADGVLHVAHAEVALPQPWLMVDVGDGVVTMSVPPEGGDLRSTLTYVTDDGIQVEIGTKSWDRRIVADPDRGWIAWADGTEGGPTELVVHDVYQHREVGRREIPAGGPRDQLPGGGPRPIALEDGTLYFAGWDGDYRWQVGRGLDPRRVTDAETYLLDVEAGVELTVGETQASVLSPDGRYAMGQTGIGSFVRLYDAATGDRIPSGIPADLAVDSVVFGPGGTILYSVPSEIVSCDIAVATCTTVVDGIDGDAVVLAG